MAFGIQAAGQPSDQERVRLPSGSATDRRARSSPRSLRSAVLAVCLTGVLSIGIPFGLLMGKDGLLDAGVNRQLPVPAPELAGCPGGPPVHNRSVRPGQCIEIIGGGFGAGELVEITESRRPGWQSYLRADGLGRFRWRYRLAANASGGPDVLSFIGTNRVEPAAFCRFTVIA